MSIFEIIILIIGVVCCTIALYDKYMNIEYNSIEFIKIDDLRSFKKGYKEDGKESK